MSKSYKHTSVMLAFLGQKKIVEESEKEVKNIRVNILNAVNADTIRIERQGDLAIIRNYRWLIDGVVLNEGLYPEDENEKGYMSLNGRLAPAGHPKDGGNYVAISNLSNESATKALAGHYIGARVFNDRKEGEYYYCDIEVNTRLAKASDKGTEVVNWIEAAEKYLSGKGEKPKNLHTSTGLNTIRVNASGESRGKKYSWIATNQNYDHLAILPGEIGAGGDELSLSVNEEGEEVMVINCDITNEMSDEISSSDGDDIASESRILNALKKLLKFNTGESSDSDKTTWDERVMNKFLEALNAAGIETEGMNEAQVFDAYNQMMSKKAKESESDDMSDDEEENMKDKKKDKMQSNSEEIPAWAQGILDKVNSLESAFTANSDKEKAPIIAKVMAANKAFTEEQLKGFSVEQLNSLLPQQGFMPVVGGDEHLTGNQNMLGDDYSFGKKEA